MIVTIETKIRWNEEQTMNERKKLHVNDELSIERRYVPMCKKEREREKKKRVGKKVIVENRKHEKRIVERRR